MDTKALQEKLTKLHGENKALLELAATQGSRPLTKDEDQVFAARMDEMASIKSTVERYQMHAADEAILEEMRARGAESRGRRTETSVGGEGPSYEDEQLAFRGWALGKNAQPEHYEAAKRCGTDITRSMFDMVAVKERDRDGKQVTRYIPVRTNTGQDIVEKRALSVGTTTAGGNSVQAEAMQAFTEAQKWYANLRPLAQSVQTATGATLPWPTVTDTSNTGEILAEATTATTSADPTFGVVNIGAFKFSSKALLVSIELLQDSFLPLEGYIGTALGRRIGRINNTKFTLGAGTTEPTGIVVGSATGVTAAATTAFTFDEIIDLIHSVDLAYRGMPGTGFMMHDTVVKAVRKLKDGNGRYIWEPSGQVGVPDRLLGYPLYVNNDMSATFTTGQKLMLFGNFNQALVIRDAGAVRFIRSDERYVLEHQVAFLAWQRSSSEVVDTTAVKHLKLG